MSLVHPQRFTAPPETIADLLRGSRRWHLVRGEILSLPPPGSRALTLPYELPTPDAVLARADYEEAEPYARPRLLTFERGRDFYLADARERPLALVRVGDDGGRLHPDVELHLGSPFASASCTATPTAWCTAFVRACPPASDLRARPRAARIVPAGDGAAGSATRR